MTCLKVLPGSPTEKEIVDLYLSGESLKEIGKAYGFSLSTAHCTLKRAGITARNTKFAKQEFSDGLTHGQRAQAKIKADPKRKAYYRDKRYGASLRRKYGITLEDYQDLEVLQGGVCDICQSTNPHREKLVVDHDHKDGHVRGLLCDECNHLLGNAKDDPEILRKAISYLETQLPSLSI